MPKAVMTKAEFKTRWESDDCGGGITWDDVADHAEAWGLVRTARIMPMQKVLQLVLKAADCEEVTHD